MWPGMCSVIVQLLHASMPITTRTTTSTILNASLAVPRNFPHLTSNMYSIYWLDLKLKILLSFSEPTSQIPLQSQYAKPSGVLDFMAMCVARWPTYHTSIGNIDELGYTMPSVFLRASGLRSLSQMSPPSRFLRLTAEIGVGRTQVTLLTLGTLWKRLLMGVGRSWSGGALHHQGWADFVASTELSLLGIMNTNVSIIDVV
jgi:hypothetical protein